MNRSAANEKKIKVLYFAVFREKRGTSEESVSTSCETPLELYAELSAEHDFPFDPDNVRVAVNDELGDWKVPIEDGDTVVFLAPFGGG